jgi:hypothetical protein
MENQETQKKKFFSLTGKKKVIAIVCLGILVWICIGSLIGPRTMDNRHGLLTRIDNTAVVVKDFEPLGLVFAESIATGRKGYGTTYDMLMKEAAQKGADAIINVNISPTKGVFNKTWSGSALAIKYLETVSAETSIIGEVSNSGLLTQGRRGFGRGWF